MKHVNIIVKGKVQKVSFRLTTKAVANQVGVRGFVMNKPDGSVYIEAEGDDFGIDSLLDFCGEGPEGAIVESVECLESSELKNFTNFEVVKKAL